MSSALASLEITSAPAELQDRLTRLNDARLRPRTTAALSLSEEMKLRESELEFIESERDSVISRAAQAPTDVHGFINWYEGLKETGPGQDDPLFPWLANDASLDQVAWFLSQEVAGEAGFDDLVSLTQIKLPVRPKLELARNYWDEMGRGKASGMHGPMLDKLAKEVGVSERNDAIVWESTALGNLLIGLAANRRYAYQAVGALGVVELTAPGRAVQVNLALERLDFTSRARQYYALHATLDVRHSAAWNAEVIAPLVREDPRLARPIAEGALMRLNAGLRCFERYRREFGI